MLSQLASLQLFEAKPLVQQKHQIYLETAIRTGEQVCTRWIEELLIPQPFGS